MVKVVAAIILVDDQILLSRRPQHKHQGGKWEFPGGKQEAGETAIQALKRECYEELGIEIESAELFDSVYFDYGDKKVSIEFFLCCEIRGKAYGREQQAVNWFDLTEIKQLEFPAANQGVVEKLLNSLES